MPIIGKPAPKWNEFSISCIDEIFFAIRRDLTYSFHGRCEAPGAWPPDRT
jgi:hypothetical protein